MARLGEGEGAGPVHEKPAAAGGEQERRRDGRGVAVGRGVVAAGDPERPAPHDEGVVAGAQRGGLVGPARPEDGQAAAVERVDRAARERVGRVGQDQAAGAVLDDRRADGAGVGAGDGRRDRAGAGTGVEVHLAAAEVQRAAAAHGGVVEHQAGQVRPRSAISMLASRKRTPVVSTMTGPMSQRVRQRPQTQVSLDRSQWR